MVELARSVPISRPQPTTSRCGPSTGSIASATVHIVRGGVGFDEAASLVGGRWVAAVQPGDVVTIEPGGIVDGFGETNGSRITL